MYLSMTALNLPALLNLSSKVFWYKGDKQEIRGEGLNESRVAHELAEFHSRPWVHLNGIVSG